MVALRIADLYRELDLNLEKFSISRESFQIEFCDDINKELDISDY